MTEQRYHWRKPSDLPDRVELFDTVANHRVGVITVIGREFKWERSTTLLLNGAPPVDGVCMTLTTAKRHILKGLPDE